MVCLLYYYKLVKDLSFFCTGRTFGRNGSVVSISVLLERVPVCLRR